MSNIKQLDEQYVAHTYARFPVEITEGKGSLLYGADGKEYIDMGSGIAVNIFGACDPDWVKAVTEQASKLQHTSNLYYTEPCAQLAKLICEKTGAKKVFFGNSGAEANECAIKIARKYAADKKGADIYKIITMKNSFHGRTITTLAATGQDVFHKDFQPLTEGFLYAEPNDLESVKQLVKDNKVAAIMFECVLGEGGVLTLDDSFVKGIAQLAKEEDILLICDEVQTGNGRCGEVYAYMHYGIQPDVITTAKGLGGGLPIGACVMFDKTEDVLGYSDHGSTFGGNPVSCAGAVSVLSRVDEKLLADVNAKSEYIFKTLANAKGVKSVSGLGLMIGIETEKDASEVISECMAKGVLVLKAKTKVRLLPPLNIPMELLEKAIEIIINACA